jgi:hypothetical protein
MRVITHKLEASLRASTLKGDKWKKAFLVAVASGVAHKQVLGKRLF